MRNATQRRIAVVGGGLAGLEAAVAAADGGAFVELFEAGPRTRTRHVNWDTAAHAGDEKVRSWTSDGWGAGGGLSERLGGRSLCYHGVLIGIEPTALASWGPAWSARLTGDGGLYASILGDLRASFSELEAKKPLPQLAALGLQHVPQAARFDERGLFEAYTPLERALELAADGRIQLTRGRVRAVEREGKGCVVRMARGSGPELRRGFDACALASSAIGNVQILAASLGRDIMANVTDHLCVGAFVRLPPGPSLRPFRHRMLWSGFAAAARIGANLFFLERPPLPHGDRIVQIQGVLEQRGGIGSYSELRVEMLAEGRIRTHIRAKLSDADRDALEAARAEIRRWAEHLAGGAVVDIARGGLSAGGNRYDSGGAPWLGHDEAVRAVTTAGAANAFAAYEIPYGAFEHEGCTHPIGGGPVPVSPDLEVAELPGVHVAGPGVFPRLGIANPALTTIALSRWLGVRLSGG